MTTYDFFLAAFGKTHSFQTFCDKGRDKKLIRQFHGTIGQYIDELTALNKKGSGVYFTVNQTNLEGRATKHITKVRAVFCDFDGTPMPEKFDVEPHFIINTSPNKYHTYWLIKDMPLQSFTLYQQSLASKFGSDPVVKDLPRIMRIAGFYHQKKKPYPVKIIKECITGPYSMDEIRDGLGLERPKKKVYQFNKDYNHKFTGDIIGANQGERHAKLVSMLVAMIKRGETYDYARGEVLEFSKRCSPIMDYNEVMFQLNDVWNRYATS